MTKLWWFWFNLETIWILALPPISISSSEDLATSLVFWSWFWTRLVDIIKCKRCLITFEEHLHIVGLLFEMAQVCCKGVFWGDRGDPWESFMHNLWQICQAKAMFERLLWISMFSSRTCSLKAFFAFSSRRPTKCCEDLLKGEPMECSRAYRMVS